MSILNLAKVFNSKCIFIPERKGESNTTLANISKAKNILNWKPAISLKEGINSMIS